MLHSFIRNGWLWCIVVMLFVPVTGCTKAARQKRHLANAERYYQSQDWERARIEYMNVLKLGLLHPTAVERLATILFEQGKLREAAPFLIKAAEMNPGNLELRCKLAQLYLTAGRIANARKEALAVLEKNPALEEAVLVYANTPTNASQIAETQRTLNEVRKKVGDQPGINLGMATLQFRQRNFKAWEDLIRQAVTLAPQHVGANLAMAQLFLAQTNLSEAERCLKTATEHSPPKGAAHLRYAELQLRLGHEDAAKSHLQAVTDKAPDFVAAWTLQARIAFSERRFADCAALLDKALLREPRDFDARMLKAQLSLSEEKTDQALAELEFLKERYPRAAPLHYQFGVVHLQNKDISRAISSLTLAVSLNPNMREAALLLAELNILRGEPAPAILLLTQLIKDQPRSSQPYALLANAYLQQNNSEDALRVYLQAMKEFPANPQWPHLGGLILKRQGKLAEARNLMNHSLRILPEYLPAVSEIVGMDLASTNITSAQKRLSELLAKEPKSAGVTFLQARIHSAQGQQALMEASLLKSIELDPDFRSPYLLLAAHYVKQKKSQEALEKVEGLLRRNPKDYSALMLKATLLTEMDEHAKSIIAFEELLKLNPRNGPVLNTLAYILALKVGEPDQALDHARLARELMPKDPNTADTLGWIYYLKKDYPRALSLLLESAAALPAQPEVQYHLGMTHYMMGQLDPAKVALRNAVRSPENFLGKAEAESRLALLENQKPSESQEAMVELERQVKQQPNDLLLRLHLAETYERKGMLQPALGHYEHILKLNPQTVKALAGLARLHGGPLKNSAKGLEYAREARKYAPDDPLILYLVGKMAFQSTQAADQQWAISLLEESARKLPRNAEVIYDLALSYFARGLLIEAERAATNAISLDPEFGAHNEASHFLDMIRLLKNPTSLEQEENTVKRALTLDPVEPAHLAAGILHQQRKQSKEAQIAFEKVLGRYPLCSLAMKQLATLFATDLQDPDKAYEWASKARTVLKEDPILTRIVGITLFQRKEYRNAVLLLQETSRLKPDDAEVLYYLGMAHFQLKQNQESKTALNKALALNGKDKMAEEAKRILVLMH
jgi:tetratricopeptide (TPR) repeat protein